MSGIDPPVSKEKKEKRLLERRLIKQSCSQYFDVEVGSNNNVTGIICKKMRAVFTTNTGRSKRKRITWDSISAFIEICRWFRFHS